MSSEPRQEEAEADSVVPLEAPVPEDPTAPLLARISELEARLRTVSAAYREKQDEIQLTKDRLTRQASAQEEIRRGEAVMAIFEPVENLGRSLQSLRTTAPEAVVGVEMVYGQFVTALKVLGLEEVPGEGAKFDPALHEAIASEPVADAARDNTVLRVFSHGYRIGTRLIRPARVVIGSYVESVGEA